MFWKLPREVFDLIIYQLAHNDLVALSTVSKSLRVSLATVIWKRICVDVQHRGTDPRQPRVNDEAVARCAATFRQPSAAIRQVTQLDIRCGFANRHYLGTPCPHAHPPHRDDEEEGPSIRLTEAQDKRVAAVLGERLAHYKYVAEHTETIIKSLEEGQLQGFSWDLATCVPPAVIKALSTRHPRLTSLRLVTDCTCPGPPRDEPGVVDLTSFRHLKRLSWKGLAPHNARQLRDAIRKNRHHLEELELDLHNIYPEIPLIVPPGVEAWDYFYGKETPEDMRFRDDILSMELRPSPPGPSFPSLRVLRLRLAPLDPGDTQRTLCRMIDFAALESLTLCYCSGWEEFLVAVRESITEKLIKLRTLEVKCDERNDGPGIIELGNFVNSFVGLADLFVGVTNSGPSENPGPNVWYALHRHRATLRRLVIHWRASFGFRTGYVRDSLVLGLSTAGPTYEPLSGFDLECFGLCCDPDVLPSLLRPFTSKSTLKVFHLRQTGADLNRGEECRALDLPRVDEPGCEPNELYRVKTLHPLEYDTLEDAMQDSFRALLDWVFGPDGIASLQLVAYGEFGQGRNSLYLHNLFVCRTKDDANNGGFPYRVFDARDRKHEQEWAAIVRPHWAFLEACPVGSFQSDAYYHF